MKLLILLALLSCNANKKLTKNDSTKMVITNCPDDGVCTFEVKKNSTLLYKKEKSTGNFYSEISESEKEIVLKLEYIRNEKPNVQDSGYRETIHLAINSDEIEQTINSITEDNAKLVFGRYCFCRGQTGDYKVNNGNLVIKKIKENSYNIKLTFKIDGLPQIITSIDENFSI